MGVGNLKGIFFNFWVSMEVGNLKGLLFIDFWVSMGVGQLMQEAK
jgi:hypothetical protein